ncbi:hypothetical protein U0070_026667, partial [Myodes glareolus]
MLLKLLGILGNAASNLFHTLFFNCYRRFLAFGVLELVILRYSKFWKPLYQLEDMIGERLRTHSIESSGKLKISPEQHWDFTAEDLKDLGEIGRGAYGSVNKMVHKPSGQIMAV